jgi:hypothetical protein
MNHRSEPASQLMIFTLEGIVDLVRRGQIRIPQYGRRFMWRQQQVALLFDSIIRGYPIGTLMFSEAPAPAAELVFGSLHIQANDEDRAYWLIDGQQRLITMAACLDASSQKDRRFALAYDFQEGTVVPARRPSRDDVIPLSTLFESRLLYDWIARTTGDALLLEQATDIAWRIRRYQISATIIQDENPGVALEIFERLNTSGSKLHASDLFSAHVAGATSRNQGGNIEDIIQRIADRTGFGYLDPTTILRSLLATRTVDVTSFPATSNPTELLSIYIDGQEALDKTIAFLQDHAEIPHLTFLPHKYALIVITRFLYLYPNADQRTLRLLRRWLWRATAVGASLGEDNNTLILRQTLSVIHDGSVPEALQALLRTVGNRPRSVPRVSRLQLGRPASRMVLCSWWNAHPRDLRTGSPFTRAELSDAIGESRSAQNVLRQIAAVERPLASSLENRMIFPNANVTGPMSAVVTHRPVGVSEDVWQQVLASHGLTPATIDSLRIGDIERFLEARAKTLRARLALFLNEVCEWEFEDTPSLFDLVLEDGEGEEDRG